MKNLLLVCFIFLVLSASCQSGREFPESFTVEISNPLEGLRKNTFVLLPEKSIYAKAPQFNPLAFVVLNGSSEIPSQYNTTDIHKKGIAFVLPEMKGKGTVRLTVRYARKGAIARNYQKLTQAELSHKEGGKWVNREYIGGNFRNVQSLRVPAEHKDHSWFIRYEGPGWESDMVGYRFYLDQRNATDVFGKKVTEPVLQNIGQEGFDSYHEMQPWGMDVMKVGKSLGLGSIGYLKDNRAVRVEKTDSVSCSILENGPVYSSFVTRYHGWNTGDATCSLESIISIHAGTRSTSQTIHVKGDVGTLITGIVRDTLGTFMSSPGGNDSFGYIATYGKQSLNNDNLGLVVFFNPGDLISFTKDDQSHIVVLRVQDHIVRYVFAAAWEGEPGGITSIEGFRQYISKAAKELAYPVTVKF